MNNKPVMALKCNVNWCNVICMYEINLSFLVIFVNTGKTRRLYIVYCTLAAVYAIVDFGKR